MLGQDLHTYVYEKEQEFQRQQEEQRTARRQPLHMERWLLGCSSLLTRKAPAKPSCSSPAETPPHLDCGPALHPHRREDARCARNAHHAI